MKTRYPDKPIHSFPTLSLVNPFVMKIFVSGIVLLKATNIENYLRNHIGTLRNKFFSTYKKRLQNVETAPIRAWGTFDSVNLYGNIVSTYLSQICPMYLLVKSTVPLWKKHCITMHCITMHSVLLLEGQ